MADRADVYVPLPPGWLHQAMKDAVREVHYVSSPRECIRLGLTVTLPIGPEDQTALYAAMNARFQQWTGKSLAEFRP